MKKLFYKCIDLITVLIDFFYPLFGWLFSIQMYRYAVCGSINCITSIGAYFIGFHYVFREHSVHIWNNIYLSAPIAADYLFGLWISFPIGFMLNRYVVFQDSELKKHIQLYRYFLVTVSTLMLNYVILKISVEKLHIFPTFAKIITVLVLILYSYLLQTKYSFK
ncbi:MAG: GtrA family protein [Phycisphaerales bacterium]|nr:GtrA family protein [Phycisphaerales bacterium]